jgi:hypothetical protein
MIYTVIYRYECATKITEDFDDFASALKYLNTLMNNDNRKQGIHTYILRDKKFEMFRYTMSI